jgi:DUF917 family protein
MRKLDMDAARAAAMGGLVFGAGGGGLERGLRAAEAVFQLGQPVLATLDELRDDDQIIVTTGVGAPGQTKQLVWPKDSLRAIELVREAWDGRPIVGVMSSHPGAFTPASWLSAALDPSLVVVDCATNGRGHPTVHMGGMGLAGRKDVQIIQAGAGGVAEEEGYIELVARGPLGAVASVLHHASSEAGGSLAACRGPFSVAFCREAAAVGAVSACIRLGEAMLAAEGKGAEAMIAAVVETLGGRELGRGRLVQHQLEPKGNWAVGRLLVDAGGAPLEISVCNEYMAVERGDERLTTFPDLIVTLSPRDGMPSAAARMEVGEDVAVVAVPASKIPLGAGVRDASVYTEVQEMIGKDLVSYALAEGSRS